MLNKAILHYICSWNHGSLHVYSGWWFSPWELWWVWLVDVVVLHLGLQITSGPSVLSLTPLLGTLVSVQWLAASICLLRLWQSLSEDSYIRLLSACTSWHPQVSEFGHCIWHGSPGGAVSSWSFPQDLFIHKSCLYEINHN